MKKITVKIFMFLVIITSINLFAAEPNTKAGSKSLYFGLNGLSEIGFDNTNVGFQYIFTDKNAIRVEMGFNSQTNKANELADELSQNIYNFSIGYLYYAIQTGPVAIYLSPQFGFGGGSSESSSNSKTSTSKLTAGVSLGVEYWAFENISFSLSTLFGMQSRTTTQENGTQKVESTSNNIGILGSSQSKFLISFYF